MDVNNQGLNLPSNLQNLDVRNELLSTEVGSGASCAYSLRDLTGSNKKVVRVRREPHDSTNSIDDERIFGGQEVQAGYVADWVNGKLEHTLPADIDSNNCAGAYSLRKVKASYNDNAVRIRRIDNTEVDVAFDSDGKVSTSSSITNVGSGDVDNTDETTLGNFLQGEADVRALFNNASYNPTASTSSNNYWRANPEIDLGTGAFTWSCDFILTDSFGVNTSRIMQTFDSSSYWYWESPTRLRYQIAGSASGTTFLPSTTTIQLGRKYNMEFSRDASNNTTLKIDGVLVGTNTTTDRNSGQVDVGRLAGFRLAGSAFNFNFNNGQHIYAGDGVETSNWVDTGTGGNDLSKEGSPVAFTGQGMDSFVDTWYDQTKDLTQISTYFNATLSSSNIDVNGMTEEFGTFLGRDNAVKLTSTGGNTQRFDSIDFGIGAGESVRFTAQIYVPSTNTALDSFAYSEKFDSLSYDRKQGVITPTQDQWVDIDFNYVQSDDTVQRIIFWNSASTTPTANNVSNGDIIYFRNMVVTRVTKGQTDAVQETANDQPKIAENGALLDGILFDNGSIGTEGIHLQANTMITGSATDNFVSAVIDRNSLSSSNMGAIISTRSGNFDGFTYGIHSNGYPQIFYTGYGNYSVSTQTIPTSGKVLLSFDKDNTVGTIHYNSATPTPSSNTLSNYGNSSGVFNIGSINRPTSNPSNGFMGLMSEVIVYNSDQASNRFLIESNINNYYGLYNDANETNGDFDETFSPTADGTFTPNGKDGFTLAVVSNTVYAGIKLNSDVTSGDSIYVSFNCSFDAGSPSPKIALRDTDSDFFGGGTLMSNEESVINGFNSFTLTSTNSSASGVVLSEADNNLTYSISNFKVSRIARNGFVETWYDQSGNGNDASQASANNQPSIIRNGNQVTLDNGTPSIAFERVINIDSLSISTPLANEPYTFFATTVNNASNAWFRLFGESNASPTVLLRSNNTIEYRPSDSDLSGAISATTTSDNIVSGFSGVNGGADGILRFNGTNLKTDISRTQDGDSINLIGRFPNTGTGFAHIESLVFYESDLTSDFDTIEEKLAQPINIL